VPATDQLTLRGNFGQNTRVEIRDVSGRLLQESMISGTGSSINVGELSAGIYFIRVGDVTQRFQKIN
jgi:hypothetical protein